MTEKGIVTKSNKFFRSMTEKHRLRPAEKTKGFEVLRLQPLGQQSPRTTVTYDNCHLWQLSPMTTVTYDNCHLWQLPPMTTAT